MCALNFHFLLVFSTFSSVFSDEDYYQVRACCAYSGEQSKDIEYTILTSFNKHIMMQYNSTRGNWTGFTAFSIYETQFWNADPYDRLERIFEKKLLCEDNVKSIESVGNLTTAPTVSIKLLRQPDGGHPALLLCSAYDFYPKQIRMTWSRNKQEVTSGVMYSDLLADGDLYYQIHSYLEYTPTFGETISCTVEHASLSEPKVTVWDNSLLADEVIQIIVGLCFLMLGSVIVTSGLIYYRKQHAAYSAVCQGGTLIPVEHISSPGVAYSPDSANTITIDTNRP
ncbi:rano class II histocompatibility antigen, A beta chain-like [Menidia menidia]